MSTADLTRMHLATQNPEGGLEAAIESGGRASEAPTVTESTPAKLSDPVPQSVYRNAKDGKQVHMSGKSRRTLRRQKKTLRDLIRKNLNCEIYQIYLFFENYANLLI
jgi:hypothetical protein